MDRAWSVVCVWFIQLVTNTQKKFPQRTENFGFKPTVSSLFHTCSPGSQIHRTLDTLDQDTTTLSAPATFTVD